MHLGLVWSGCSRCSTCARARRKKGGPSNKYAKRPFIDSPPPANSGDGPHRSRRQPALLLALRCGARLAPTARGFPVPVLCAMKFGLYVAVLALASAVEFGE
jgi:hypothetical protein